MDLDQTPGVFQSSLRDEIVFHSYPALKRRATIRRPCGTLRRARGYRDPKPNAKSKAADKSVCPTQPNIYS
jgi:hypothetical protein